MAQHRRVYGCGKDVESQNEQLNEPTKISKLSYVSGPANANSLSIEAAFNEGAAVYKLNERGKDGKLIKVKGYVCCAEVQDGIMHYRLKDKPPPDGQYITDWIPEHSLQEWSD